MKKIAAKFFVGKDDRYSGLIAFAIVGLIALGCTCGDKFDLANLGKNDNTSRTESNSSIDSTSSKPTTKADASTGQVPADDQLQEIARETIMDFNDAIQSRDFTDFHRTISKPFQKQVSPERFKETFKAFIDLKINFREISTLDADFTSTPAVESSLGNKILKLKGNYPTTPRRTNFELKYVPEGQDWKLIGIEINTKDQSTETP